MHAKPIARRPVILLAIAVLLATAVAVLATAGHHVVPVLELMHYHGRHLARVIAMHYFG